MGKLSVLEELMRGRDTITGSFSIRPSWCDAKLALEQIEHGKAKGFKLPLFARKYMQTCLYFMGAFIQKYAVMSLIISVAVMAAFCVPLKDTVLETNIEKLWVPRGGRLEDERNFMERINKIKFDEQYADKVASTPGSSPDDSGLGDLAGIQVLIQTAREDNGNILTRDQLLLHVEVMKELSVIAVDMFGANWTLLDLCFKPSLPLPADILGSADLANALQNLIPCVSITPMDCFWEGSKPKGPFPPNDKLFGAISIAWTVLDPTDALALLNNFPISNFDPAEVTDMFKRSGIEHAYQTLPCIDPLDRGCPKTSPNYVGLCDVIDRFLNWNDGSKEYVNFTRIPTTTESPNDYGDYSQFYDSGSNSSGGFFGVGDNDEDDPPECRVYADRIKALLYNNNTLLRLMGIENIFSGYGERLTGGCRGFAPKFMQWPEQLIVGGRVPKNGTIEKVSALQTVLMLATSEDIFNRFSAVNQTLKPNLNSTQWSLSAASLVLKQWQRKYSQTVYNWVNNTQGKRILHPLAAASVTDMVEQFSSMNWNFVFIGYAIMIFYASITALSFSRHGIPSSAGLAFGGCMTVMLSTASGLGFTLLVGISFNATTTQIVPFLLLSMGSDEMFLFLHKYRELNQKLAHDEIGVLLRETGLSVVITYVINIIAFVAGVILPIPALKVFCVQVALVLLFNMLAIMVTFPAMMALDLRRKKAKRTDVLCCLRFPDEKLKHDEKKSHWHHETNGNVPAPAAIKKPIYKRITLTKFVRDHYAPVIQHFKVKIGLTLIFVGFFIAAMVGIFRIPIGLELSELIPKASAPYSFMLAREKYFSFYNIFMVVRGPDVDYSDLKTQQLMNDYLQEIRAVSYTVKMELKNDWVSLMRDWLSHIETEFKNDWKNKVIDSNGIKSSASKSGIIAYKLLCNQFGKIDCSKVTENSTLFRSDGLLEPRLFNKSVTAWFHGDPMTYYVSQANFHPLPESWDPRADDLEIPDAPSFWITQIPLFIDGIVDTAITMDMIEKYRTIAENYTSRGFSNFPFGLPFTFWELYIYLTNSIIIAMGIITAAVFVALSIILVNPWISALIVIVLVFMVIIELGFMGLFHIKLNPISAVTLITAVGIRVKFTVHVALSFITTVGTRNTRIARTLEHMFIPVLHGGISTLLGLVMVAFTDFEFILMYYFWIMFALVILGMMGGLILMPVLLSWIGPPAEVIPLDNIDYLPPPSSAFERHTHSNVEPVAASAGDIRMKQVP